jgi:hypothetical protein
MRSKRSFSGLFVASSILLVLGGCAPQVDAKALIGKSGLSVPNNKLRSPSGAEVQGSNIQESTQESAHERALKNLIRTSDFYSIVHDLENQEKVDCMGPKMTQVHWMCLNGPQCGFRLDLTCATRISTFAGNDRIVRISFTGNTNAEKGEAAFSSTSPEITHYELKKAD